MTRPVVRRAMLADVRAVAEIHVAGWQVGYRGILPADFLAALSVDAREQRHRARIESPSSELTRLWVGELDGVVAGFALTGSSRDEGLPRDGEIFAIYVAPGHWRHGVGAALTIRSVDEFRQQGFEAASLWVLRDNARARRFYERQGFAADGAEKPIELGGVEVLEVRYRRLLGTP